MINAIQTMIDWSEFEDEQSYGPWLVIHKGDQSCRVLADQHYSRITKGAKQFTRPGENIVLRTADGSALWVSWRTKFERKDGYGKAIECSIFRNESSYLSSDLIKMGLYATTKIWGDLPKDGFLTYVDPKSVQSENAGYCFEKAGFRRLKQRSSRGLIPYLTDQESLNLVLEEMSVVHLLNGLQSQMVVALNSGEFMDAYEFQELAERQMHLLEKLKVRMKRMGLKAWSSFEAPFTKLDLDLITSPYDGWMMDNDYLKRKGLVLEDY